MKLIEFSSIKYVLKFSQFSFLSFGKFVDDKSSVSM